MLNFTGMLKAPGIEKPASYVATYSDGFKLERKEIEAPNRMVAYAIASMRPPLGCALTKLRKKKAPRCQAVPSFDERVDVKLTRVLSSVYINTDLACRMVMDEIRDMARSA